jgi:hypothetical protein
MDRDYHGLIMLSDCFPENVRNKIGTLQGLIARSQYFGMERMSVLMDGDVGG